MLCTAKHRSLRSRKPKLYGEIKSSYSHITAAIEKLLYFWVDISDKRATNSTGIRANWINCLLTILKVLLNLHNFPLLNINCTEPYLGPLYRSDIIVQIFNCKIPERSLLNGAVYKRFQRFHAGEDVRPVTSALARFYNLFQVYYKVRQPIYYKVRQVLQSATILLQYNTITLFKEGSAIVRQNIRPVWGVTNLEWQCKNTAS